MTDRELDEALQARLVLDARPGPAARITKERAASMIDQALGAAFHEGALDAALAPPVTRLSPAPRKSRLHAIVSHPVSRATVLAAAVLLMLVGGAAAAKLVVQAFFDEPKIELPVSAPEPVKAPRNDERARADEAAVEPAELEALEETPVLEATEVREPRKREPRDADAVPDDLLQRASRARTAGRFREAAETYALVYERHPSTLSAYVAEVAAGSIELEHLDRPERAAKLFRRALRDRPYGALDLEARQGLALALRDLGRTQEEIAALKALIAAHSDRPAAQRARARLAELTAP